MIVQQFFVKGIAYSSYLLGGTRTCAIIDPRRPIISRDAAPSTARDRNCQTIFLT